VYQYPSVNLSPTLSKNEKVEQHIRKKTHKPNALRFEVEGGVIFLYELAQFSFLFVSPVFTPLNYPTESLLNFCSFLNPKYLAFSEDQLMD